MSDRVAEIARAVLYEGHVLWPYRRSALKNQQRWTFGGVYPEAYARAHEDRSSVQFECLVEGSRPRVEVEVRFLHVVRRQVTKDGRPVDAAEIDGTQYLSWDEVTERCVAARDGGLPIEVPAGRVDEALDGIVLVRTWEQLDGLVDVDTTPVEQELHRLTVRIENRSTWRGTERGEAMRRTFVSAHAVVRVREGELVSAIDPPARLREQSQRCRNDGLWPVLVGDEGERHTMLAAPIILYDYPQVAPESPGDFFDGCEIDQLLVLNVLGLTDEERQEMRASDPRAREILERTDAMSPDDLMRLHGTLRDVRTLRE